MDRVVSEEMIKIYIGLMYSAMQVDDWIHKINEARKTCPKFRPVVSLDHLEDTRRAMILEALTLEKIFEEDLGIDIKAIIEGKGTESPQDEE